MGSRAWGGGQGRNRTDDTRFTKPLLYLLSYSAPCMRVGCHRIQLGGGPANSFLWVGEFTLVNRQWLLPGSTCLLRIHRVRFADHALTTNRLLTIPVFPDSLTALDFQPPLSWWDLW